MKISATNTRQQSIEQSSVEELNLIYFSGYVEQMMESDPEKLLWEINEYQQQFSKKN